MIVFNSWTNCDFYYYFFTDASVFDYLCGELRRGYLLENDEQRFAERREKFYIFLRIPREIEKVLYFLFYRISYFHISFVTKFSSFFFLSFFMIDLSLIICIFYSSSYMDSSSV